MAKSKKQPAPSHQSTTASQPLSKTTDKYICYERSVNAPQADLNFIIKAYRIAYHKKPITLREDFCGTAALLCQFVASDVERTGYGVDNDQDVLQWAKQNGSLAKNPNIQDRVHLVWGDSFRDTLEQPVDVVVAFNYALCFSHTRTRLLEYLRNAFKGLDKKCGMFVADLYGGTSSYVQNKTSKREFPEFTYIWEQISYDFASNIASNALSFKFPDGSMMKRVFTYQFRLWTLRDIEEALYEVGFTSVTFWVAESDDNGTIGEFTERKEIRGDIETFNAFIVATLQDKPTRSNSGDQPSASRNTTRPITTPTTLRNHPSRKDVGGHCLDLDKQAIRNTLESSESCLDDESHDDADDLASISSIE
mmetsp:Transcript_21860/g.37678  ORF Transcript_21860/g.37678 Transcript_21860/m.37678 type:complete len:364 (-) Transcript_21860:978-2069(-)